MGSGTGFYVANNIFWYNNDGGNDIAGIGYGQYAYCNIGNGGSPGNGNIHQEPMFVDRVNEDYHILDISPCVDAGSKDYKEWAFDVDGDPRNLDGDWNGNAQTDIGADEVCHTDLTVAGDFKPNTTFTLEIKCPVHGDALYYLFVAAKIGEIPLTDPPGYELGLYGTFLLDPWSLLSYSPLFSGQLSSGAETLNLALPADAPPGVGLGFQAFLKDPLLNAGEGSPAAGFIIQEP